MSIVKTMFVHALEEVSLVQDDLKDRLSDEDTEAEEDDIAELDSALDVLLSNRNEYCRSRDMAIEDGHIDWCKSDAQRENESTEQTTEEESGS